MPQLLTRGLGGPAGGLLVGGLMLGIVRGVASLQRAIVEHLSDDPAIQEALPGGIWPDLAPEYSTLPRGNAFAVVADPQDAVTEVITTSGDCLDSGTIQVSVFVPGVLQGFGRSTDVMATREYGQQTLRLVARSLRDAFRAGNLRLLDGTLIDLRQAGPPIHLRPKQELPESDSLRHQLMNFEYMIAWNVNA